MLKRLLCSTAFLSVLMYITMGHTMLSLPLPSFLDGKHFDIGLIQLCLALIVMIINKKLFISGARSIINRAPNMDALVSIGSAASFIYSACILVSVYSAEKSGNHILASEQVHGLYFESAAMILTLITLGKLLEARSKGRTTDALNGLIALSP